VKYVTGGINRVFGFPKVRYRRTARNEYRLKVICALYCIYCAPQHDQCLY